MGPPPIWLYLLTVGILCTADVGMAAYFFARPGEVRPAPWGWYMVAGACIAFGAGLDQVIVSRTGWAWTLDLTIYLAGFLALIVGLVLVFRLIVHGLKHGKTMWQPDDPERAFLSASSLILFVFSVVIVPQAMSSRLGYLLTAVVLATVPILGLSGVLYSHLTRSAHDA